MFQEATFNEFRTRVGQGLKWTKKYRYERSVDLTLGP